MYKRLITIILCFALCLSAFNFVGCASDNSFTVTFSSGHEEASLYYGKEVQVVTSAKQIKEPIYVREGYNFVGWNVSLSRINKDTKVVAQWKKYEIQVVFYANGGFADDGSTVVSLTVDSAKEIIDKQPQFKKKGYALSWDTELATIGSSCEINAIWTIKSYDLTFKDKNGQDFANNSLSITYNDKLDFGNLQAPQVAGEKFVCWQDEQGCAIDEGLIWDVDENAEFKAVYVPQSDFVITYDLDGGNRLDNGVQRSFNENSLIDVPNPTRKGFGFDGWQINGSSQTFFASEITLEHFKKNGNLVDVNLKATWNKVPYVATFDADGGLFVGEEQIEFFFGSDIQALPSPQKENYEFVGWFYGETQIEQGDSWEQAENITLVARYRAIYKIKFSLTGVIGLANNQILCKLMKWGDVPISQTLESVELQVVEGKPLLSIGISVMPVVEPIEEYLIDEYVFGGYWKYIDSNNVGHKVVANTIFNSQNLPNISAGDTIVLVPHVKIVWSPNY